MHFDQYIRLAEQILNGWKPDPASYLRLAAVPEEEAMRLLPGADLLREGCFGRTVHLCTILNAKSGRCSEDCSFCSQSAFARTDAPVYPFVGKAAIQEAARATAATPVNRFSVVTSGKRLTKRELETLCEAFAEMDSAPIRFCASLGTIDLADCRRLLQAGISRYHHNLETSESFFQQVCSSHSYQERIDTIRAAKAAGMTVCAGGLLGLGESDEQALELALTLKELDVDSVPLNFLTPIPGTRMAHLRELTPLRCLKLIALFRYVLPDKEIIICGGREANLQELHPLVFLAGASGIMTGNYLTTSGRTLKQDLRMLETLKLKVRT